jgi:hypothetical protein
MLKPETDLPEWVQSKITLAEDYITTAANYMMSEMSEATMCETCKSKNCSCDDMEDEPKDKSKGNKLLLDLAKKPLKETSHMSAAEKNRKKTMKAEQAPGDTAIQTPGPGLIGRV